MYGPAGDPPPVARPPCLCVVTWDGVDRGTGAGPVSTSMAQWRSLCVTSSHGIAARASSSVSRILLSRQSSSRRPQAVPPPAPTRRGWGRVLAATLVVIALSGAAWWWRGRTGAFTLTPDPQQNVLLVTIDTLRADALSSYGGP